MMPAGITEIPNNGEPLRILVTQRFAAAIHERLALPHTIHTFAAEDDREMARLLAATDVFISSQFKAAWGTADMPLRLIQGVGAGLDGIDLQAVPSRCFVCNVFGHGPSVAEYVFMVMAVLNRELLAQHAAMRAGGWSHGIMRRSLAGRTLLVLGLGHIGREIVRWAHFHKMHVVGLTRAPSAERAMSLGLEQAAGLDELHLRLQEADFVVVAIPHTPDTTGFIGQLELDLMKPASFLINVSRGPVVDEAALYTALARRTIAGAAIDVWYRYPADLSERSLPGSFPFHELDNLIMTPHNSGFTDRTMTYRFGFIAANIERLVAGYPLENVVWPPRVV